MSIMTIPRPKVGSCIIQPKSGIAGKTFFTILCIGFGNKNKIKNIFEYYQNDKNDKETMGKAIKIIVYNLSIIENSLISKSKECYYMEEPEL